MINMRVLLTNLPWMTEKDSYGVRAGSRWAHTRSRNVETVTYYPFPFFLAYTTALLKKNKIKADIKDCVAEECGKDDFFRFLKRNEYDVVIIETSTPSIYNDLKIAKEIKEKFNSLIVLCGTHTSALYNEIMKENTFVDFIMIGEYDYTAPDLIKTLETKKNLSKVNGIVYRKNKKIKVTPRRGLIKNLDDIPWPPYDELPMNKYNEPFCKKVPNIQMITSRGCPMNCIYCVEPSVYYGKPNLRLRSPKDVVDEIEYLLGKYHPKEIYFDDASFTVNQKHAQDIAKELIKRGIKIDWSCMADSKASYETLKLMKKSGCVSIKFGVESADLEILKNIRKPYTPKDAVRVVKYCKKLGIFTHATYMFGLPGETKESIRKTIEFSTKLGTDTAQFSVATPYPGTYFFKLCEKNKWLLTKDWSRYDGSACSVISMPNASKKIIEEAVLEARKRLFINVFKNPKLLFMYAKSSYRSEGICGIARNFKSKITYIIKPRY